MQMLHTGLRPATVGAITLALAISAGTWAVASERKRSAPLPPPHVVVTCDMDFCLVEASYVLAVPQDGHRVTVHWETRSAPGYPDNEADLWRSARSGGTGEPLPHGTGYRYSIVDFVWHSDIRCDDGVSVALTGEPFTPAAASTGKPVPDGPGAAVCSAYGITSGAA